MSTPRRESGATSGQNQSRLLRDVGVVLGVRIGTVCQREAASRLIACNSNPASVASARPHSLSEFNCSFSYSLVQEAAPQIIDVSYSLLGIGERPAPLSLLEVARRCLSFLEVLR
jgi:hypothetical protein